MEHKYEMEEKEKIYWQYKTQKRVKYYEVESARFELEQKLFNLHFHVSTNWLNLLDELEIEIDKYINVYSRDLIRYVLEYVQEKNNQ